MFRLNLEAVLGRTANERLMAKPAKAAKTAKADRPEKLATLATLATLAISHTSANEPFPTLDDLLRAAMLACDHFNDDEAARQQMRDDCATITPDKRQFWIDHFTNHYRR